MEKGVMEVGIMVGGGGGEELEGGGGHKWEAEMNSMRTVCSALQFTDRVLVTRYFKKRCVNCVFTYVQL